MIWFKIIIDICSRYNLDIMYFYDNIDSGDIECRLLICKFIF